MYCTISDIQAAISEDALRQLTDDNNLGQVDEAIVEDAIACAAEIIDSFLGGRYTLPLTTIPNLIKSLCIDLAVYELYKRRFGLTEFPEAVKDRRKNAIDSLKMMQNGTTTLGVEGLSTTTGAGEIRVNKSAADRVFSDDLMGGY